MTQYPTQPNTWLYRDEQDGTRTFTDYVIRNNDTLSWNECTNEEKLAWEEAHKPEEPIEEVLAEEVTEEVTN